MEPWPLDMMKRSRFTHPGFTGLCRRKSFHNTSAISAMPMGAPGWPELAFWTASMLRARMALARSLRSVRPVRSVREGTRLDIRWRLLSEGKKGSECKSRLFSRTTGQYATRGRVYFDIRRKYRGNVTPAIYIKLF